MLTVKTRGFERSALITEKGRTVAEVFTHAEPGDQRNMAALYAAAPAMLEALLDALPYVEDVLSDPAQLAAFKPGTVQRHAKAIRAAIAAATGEQ